MLASSPELQGFGPTQWPRLIRLPRFISINKHTVYVLRLAPQACTHSVGQTNPSRGLTFILGTLSGEDVRHLGTLHRQQ